MAGEVVPGDRWDKLVDALRGLPGVTAPEPSAGSRRFGSDALKVEKKIFAMLSQDRLVVKLPAARVAALLAAGEGEPFDAGKGKPMKEWLAVPVQRHRHWEALAREALRFVSG